MIDCKDELCSRMRRRFPFEDVKSIIKENSIIVAGGAFSKERPHDYDIYPELGFLFTYKENTNCELLTKTKNARTYRTKNGVIIQFCLYKKPTLIHLIKSFDFAHCQIGAIAYLEKKKIEEVTYTDAFIKSKMLNKTWFTGSDYPLSSLIRIQKYIKRGYFEGRSWMWETFKILTNILERGIIDYDDFKDQLDAIDLGLLPEELEEADFEDLMQLLKLLQVKR